jgi:hypothetical protein
LNFDGFALFPAASIATGRHEEDHACTLAGLGLWRFAQSARNDLPET